MLPTESHTQKTPELQEVFNNRNVAMADSEPDSIRSQNEVPCEPKWFRQFDKLVSLATSWPTPQAVSADSAGLLLLPHEGDIETLAVGGIALLCSRTKSGCFYKLGVHFLGVPIVRALLFGVYIGAPDFWKLPSKLPRAHCSQDFWTLALLIVVQMSRGRAPAFSFQMPYVTP